MNIPSRSKKKQISFFYRLIAHYECRHLKSISPAPDDREGIVDELCDQLTAQKFQVVRDKSHVAYKQSIGDFMRSIGAGNQVVTVVSDKYLRSRYCMYEAIGILNHRDLEGGFFRWCRRITALSSPAGGCGAAVRAVGAAVSGDVVRN